LKLHPDPSTDSWLSKTTRDVNKSWFLWNNESGSSSKNTSLCSMSDRKELLASNKNTSLCVNHHDKAKATKKQVQGQYVNHHDTASITTSKMPIR
jgi:hypothetical protein